MASNSKDSKVARLLLIESTGESGRLEIDKAKEVLQELRQLPKSKSIPILRNYLKLVKEKERSYQCLVEKGHSNDNSIFSENLLQRLPQSESDHTELVTSTNQSLIAGFKLRLGDDVYEDSISSRLNRLKNSLK